MLEVCRYLELQRTPFTDGRFTQLEAEIITDEWCGKGTAEFVEQDIQKFADELNELVNTGKGEVWFLANETDESGRIALRFRRALRQEQFACLIRLATHYDSTMPEGMFRLELELSAFSFAMKRFVEGLRALASGETISAKLDLEHYGFPSRRSKSRRWISHDHNSTV